MCVEMELAWGVKDHFICNAPKATLINVVVPNTNDPNIILKEGYAALIRDNFVPLPKIEDMYLIRWKKI